MNKLSEYIKEIKEKSNLNNENYPNQYNHNRVKSLNLASIDNISLSQIKQQLNNKTILDGYTKSKNKGFNKNYRKIYNF
jgi:hypothetical protein